MRIASAVMCHLERKTPVATERARQRTAQCLEALAVPFTRALSQNSSAIEIEGTSDGSACRERCT